MKRRFWQWVHDKLEQAWRWVYYHKLAPARDDAADSVRYSSVEFLTGSRGGGKTSAQQAKILSDPNPYRIYLSSPGGRLVSLDTNMDTKRNNQPK